jgi:adhesin transport system outer membrane protein
VRLKHFVAGFSAIAAVCSVTQAIAAEPFTINDAIKESVKSHPSISEATANRRATESELRQSQGVLLPQVRLESSWGPERFTRDITPAPLNNTTYQNGQNSSVVIRQLLFDGFTSINQVWQQAARVDGAAARVHERTELQALDAVEAYVDVTRYQRLVALSQENLAAHRRILDNIRSRFNGGRSGEGDLQQAQERFFSAEAAVAEFRRSLDEALGKYRSAVGLEPYNLRFPGRLRGLPASKDDSLATALRFNPTIQAAQADVEAARYGYRATAGAFVPNVSLVGRAAHGVDSDQYLGKRDEVSGKVVMSWDIFRGGQDAYKRVEAADRMIEQSSRHARLQREAFLAIDRAWAARVVTSDRIVSLDKEVSAARRVVTSYAREYELGQRTLLDLLTAENSLFNSQVSVISARGVAVFADYQLLAAIGQLLNYVKTEAPPEAAPLSNSFGLLAFKLPPAGPLFHEPGPGPEPLTIVEGSAAAPRAAAFAVETPRGNSQASQENLTVISATTVSDREPAPLAAQNWSNWAQAWRAPFSLRWFSPSPTTMAHNDGLPGSASAYASADILKVVRSPFNDVK